MALVRACHVMKKGDVAEATQIAPSIIANGLQVRLPGGLSMGKGAWGYHIDRVPDENRTKPMVVFEVDDQYVVEKPLGFLQDGRPYATLRLGADLPEYSYVPIRVLGFLNLPPSFPVYTGPIEFFSR